MDRSAIVLAGGFSKRFGQDKGLTLLAKKPLVKHVLDAVDGLADERIVVVSSKSQAASYEKVAESKARVAVDSDSATRSPLVGALTGFTEAQGEYALLLPCDVPFLSRDILALLLDLCVNKNAVIPRWPNGYIEPLHGVYCRQPALEAAKNALAEGKLNLESMVDKLRGVRYVSTLVLQQLDPELKTFFNVNTPLDLRKAESMLKRAV